MQLPETRLTAAGGAAACVEGPMCVSPLLRRCNLAGSCLRFRCGAGAVALMEVAAAGNPLAGPLAAPLRASHYLALGAAGAALHQLAVAGHRSVPAGSLEVVVQVRTCVTGQHERLILRVHMSGVARLCDLVVARAACMTAGWVLPPAPIVQCSAAGRHHQRAWRIGSARSAATFWAAGF